MHIHKRPDEVAERAWRLDAAVGVPVPLRRIVMAGFDAPDGHIASVRGRAGEVLEWAVAAAVRVASRRDDVLAEVTCQHSDKMCWKAREAAFASGRAHPQRTR